MVTGGLAAVIYGFPRMTLDIDIVIQLRGPQAEAFTGLWPASEFYLPPVEVVREEAGRESGGHFNVIHHESTLRADVYAAGDSVLNRWAMAHRVVRTIEGEAVQVAPIEAVIIGKLRYFKMGGSDRHLRDISNIIRVSGSEIDQVVLARWIRELELEAPWSKAQAFKEPE